MGIFYCYFFNCDSLLEVVFCSCFVVLIVWVELFLFVVDFVVVLLEWLVESVVFIYQYCGIIVLLMSVIDDFEFVLYSVCVVLCVVGMLLFICVQQVGLVWLDFSGEELFDLIVVFVWLWE